MRQLTATAASPSARCWTRSKRDIPCCAARCAITTRRSVAHTCASTPATTTSHTNRRTRRCRTMSRKGRSRSSSSARSPADEPRAPIPNFWRTSFSRRMFGAARSTPLLAEGPHDTRRRCNRHPWLGDRARTDPGEFITLITFMTMRLPTAMAALLAVAAAFSSAAGQRAAPDWAAFDRYVAQAAHDWKIPAMAIAVVKDDSLVFAKGYGVLQAGTNQPANEHTRFAIGSTTKAMTSASLAMLVDQGKLHFDDHVTDYIPELQLYDPYVTRELTIRDLLTHRTGLPGTDLFWY